jgi:nickel/cobalt transporter (NiCoT) family protein
MTARPGNLKGRICGAYALLIAANAGAWIWALATLRGFPVLLGTALLAYAFGLRHAVDADHIAAIDNVTRKLMQRGQRPVGVGLYFSLGHSTVVFLLCAAVALASSALRGRLGSLAGIGGVVGTCVSAGFLLAIAAANAVILVSVYRTFQAVRRGEPYHEEDLDLLLGRRGFFGRIFRSLFRLIGRSWQMYLVGFLFGLGFDTATEVAVLGISAKEAAAGLPVWSILVFPTLFTAGMALVDTTDGIVMLGAYHWAFVNPLRKLYYNLTITFVSIVVAVLIGGIEVLGMVGDHLKRQGGLWSLIGALNGHFGALGFAVVAIFALSWAASIAIYRRNRYDETKVAGPAG